MIGELFDPHAELSIDEHYRPHWSQVGALVFVTLRTRDSIPKTVLQRWHQQKIEWLSNKGVLYEGDFQAALNELSEEDAAQFRRTFQRQKETYLDGCHGRCLLRDPALSTIVAE